MAPSRRVFLEVFRLKEAIAVGTTASYALINHETQTNTTPKVLFMTQIGRLIHWEANEVNEVNEVNEMNEMNEVTKFLSSFISFISFALRRFHFRVWLSFGGLILFFVFYFVVTRLVSCCLV